MNENSNKISSQYIKNNPFLNFYIDKIGLFVT